MGAAELQDLVGLRVYLKGEVKELKILVMALSRLVRDSPINTHSLTSLCLLLTAAYTVCSIMPSRAAGSKRFFRTYRLFLWKKSSAF